MTSLIVLINSAAINGPDRLRASLVDQGDDAYIVVNQRRTMARYTRPVVSAPLPPQGGILIQYVQPPRAARKTMARLEPPTVVTPAAAPFVASPVRVELARIRPQRTQYRLGQPVVVYVVPVNFGPGVRLAPSSRGVPKSKLYPPPPLPVAGAIFFGPKVVLADSLIRLRRKLPMYVLGMPVVVTQDAQYGPEINLTYSVRGKPKSRLAAPAVVTPASTAIFFGPKVELARIRPPLTRSKLDQPAVIGGGIAYGGPRVRLTSPRDRNPAVRSRLAGPTVVATGQTFYGPDVTLVRIRPRRTLARLYAPAVVGPGLLYDGIGGSLAPLRATNPTVKSRLRAPVLAAVEATARPVDVTLAYSRRGVPKSILRKPTVVAPVLARAILVSLAPSSRGTTKSRLDAPTVVQTFRIPVITITLAPQRRGVPKSILRKPVDLVDQQDVGKLAVHLAYSRRGAPKSDLKPPTVVAPVLARAILVWLAPSSRGVPKSRLSAPTVVFPFIARPTDITLVRIRPAATHSTLRKPTDLVDTADLGYLRVHLAYSLRGKPKSHLSPPTVVAPVLARPIDTTLVRIRPARTLAVLGEPRVVLLAVELSGPEVTLTRIRPVKTMAILREPVAGAAKLKAEYDLRVTLAYQSRGRPKSKLRLPVVVTAATPYFRREPVALVRIRPRRTLALVRRPVVVRDAFTARSTLVNLAPSTRGRVRSVVRPPALLPPLARPTSTSLAYSRRGRPLSDLRAPTVVTAFTARPPLVHLAPSSRGIPKSILRPPAVVIAAPSFYGPDVTLVRIRPPRTRWHLGVVIGIVPPCYGVATGTIRPTAENEISTEPSADNRISTAAGASAAGTTAAASTMEGSTRPSAENVIGDEQREGC